MKYSFLTLLITAAFTMTMGQTPSPPASTALTTTLKAETATEGKTESSKGDFANKYVRKDAAVDIPKFETAPVIDGNLNDPIWQTATVFGDFLQTQPGDNVPPSNPTEVMMGYDSKNLYIAFRAKQERGKIRATVGRRDNVFSDDFVGVYIDTFNDQQQAYFIFLNPLGIQGDGVMTEGRGEDNSVDLVFESKGVIGDDGYTVEAAIPFKSLRYEAGKNKKWGLHLFRRIRYNNNELDSWMPNNRSVSGSLNQAGHITGLDGIETTRQLEVIPSFTVSETGRRTRFTFDGGRDGRYRNDGVKGEFGFTAKFGLTPTTTLDFAYNPDFAQVEADSPVTLANQRFPIFFPEKRPFFLERIDIFNTPLNIVNTRAIVDPDIAAKITGRRGKNTFGLMYASDAAPGNYNKDERESLLICQIYRRDQSFCPNERYVDKNAGIGVVRYKRDLGHQSNLGFVGTSYNFPDLHNYTSGFDGRIKTGTKFTTEFQLIGTTSRTNFYNPDTDSVEYRTGNGIGYNLWIERSGRNLYMNYLAFGRSADYRANVGFTERTDTNYAGSYIRYETDRDAKKAIVYKRIQNATNYSYDWKGRGQYFITDTQGMLALQKQTFVGMNLQYGREWVYENEFGPNRTATRPGGFYGPSPLRTAPFRAVQAFVESTPNKIWYLYFFVDYTSGQMEYDGGNGPDFPRVSPAFLAYRESCQASPTTCGPPPPVDPGPGDQLTIQSTIRYQPTTAFQTQLNFNKKRLVRKDTKLTAFDDNIFSWRSTYQFTRNIFTRFRLDYSTLNHHVRPQFVFGWTPNPGTAIYVGYNDDVSYNGYNPYSGRLEPGFHLNGRTFFIKASYLFKKSF